MILGGLALAFSRVIDNSVISLENIYRHLEMGSSPARRRRAGRSGSQSRGAGGNAGRRGRFLPGHAAVRREQISVLRPRSGLLSVADCFVRRRDDRDSAVLREVSERRPWHVRSTSEHAHEARRFNAWFNRRFNRMLDFYERRVRRALKVSRLTLAALLGVFVASLAIYPFLGLAFFPADRCRTIHGQHQGAHRNPHRSHQRLRRQDRRL